MRYTIKLTTYAGTSIDFETDETDPEKIEEAFWDSNPDTPSLCHQCAGGHRYGSNLELGDVWEIDRFEGAVDLPGGRLMAQQGRSRITLEALYRRDKGVCGICGRWGPIDAMNRDHQVPRAKGGGHARSNIRLAHIECNTRRVDDHSDVTGWKRVLLDFRERMTR